MLALSSGWAQAGVAEPVLCNPWIYKAEARQAWAELGVGGSAPGLGARIDQWKAMLIIAIAWQEILLGLKISEKQNIHTSQTAICFEQHSYYETLAHWNDLDSLLKLTIMRFGLHQRKAINDLIVKSNGLFSVMFLFISSVACDAIDYS